MVHWMAGLLAVAFSLQLCGCSTPVTGCKSDSDCDPGLSCIDGACIRQIVDPCLGITCPEGQVCNRGTCVPLGSDQDGDGFAVPEDCDDSNPGVNPDAVEICDGVDNDCDLQFDEDGVCNTDCQVVGAPPTSDPPFTCDSYTECDSCARYQNQNFYCRSLNGAAEAFLAIPEQAPCDPLHNCDQLSCNGEYYHCSGAEGRFVDGEVPTGDEELCNGIDDNCDGSVDEGAEETCPEWSDATASCVSGACHYICDGGYHECGTACLEDISAQSCGIRCEPCTQPEHSVATCEDGVCGFECESGFYSTGTSCLACNDNDHCGSSCEACPYGEKCCDGLCINVQEDPQNCGGCGFKCTSANDTCCNGSLCCASQTPICCGNFCCDANGECCPGDYCCPPGGTCCGQFCCAPPNTICCGEGCCPTGTYCCQNNTLCCQ